MYYHEPRRSIYLPSPGALLRVLSKGYRTVALQASQGSALPPHASGLCLALLRCTVRVSAQAATTSEPVSDRNTPQAANFQSAVSDRNHACITRALCLHGGGLPGCCTPVADNRTLRDAQRRAQERRRRRRRAVRVTGPGRAADGFWFSIRDPEVEPEGEPAQEGRPDRRALQGLDGRRRQRV